MRCRFCGGKLFKYLQVDNKFIYVCRECSIGVTIPEPKKIKYTDDDFHEQFNVNNVNDLPWEWKSSIRKQCDLIEKIFSKSSKILEIGCGQGIFLKELSDRGFRVIGIEPSHNASRIARGKNLNVITGYFPNDNIKEKFDLIIISHLLEHIKDCNKFVEATKKILSSHGCILFTQTDFFGVVPKIQRSSWYAWVTNQHYWHFNPLGLEKYLKKYSLYKVQIIRSSLVHHLFIISRLIDLLPIFGDQFHLLVRYEKKA